MPSLGFALIPSAVVHPHVALSRSRCSRYSPHPTSAIPSPEVVLSDGASRALAMTSRVRRYLPR
ncbi:MAG: hypothetical protein AB8B36_14305 [Prochlorococcus sp.]